MSQETAVSSSDIEDYLNIKFPAFMEVLSKNEKACKVLRESGSGGFTVFAPNDQAFVALGESKVASLGDPRNLETVEKMDPIMSLMNLSVPMPSSTLAAL